MVICFECKKEVKKVAIVKTFNPQGVLLTVSDKYFCDNCKKIIYKKDWS